MMTNEKQAQHDVQQHAQQKEQNPQDVLKAKNRMTLIGLLVLIAILFIVSIIKIKTQSL